MGINEPIRHHYIPQFLLRNFCNDNFGHILYFDKSTHKTYEKHTRDIFMERNFYRDEINHAQEPTQIEKDMAKFESEAAAVIKRFLHDSEIILSTDEIIMLNLFFAVMGLRSKRAGEQFADQLTDIDKRFYRRYQRNGDYTDFWKRNLGLIVNCRSAFEVVTNNNIDLPFKAFIERDTKGIFGKYFVVVDSGDNDNFIIGDTYPVLVTGDPGNIDMYSICPLSPKRILLIASKGVISAPAYATMLRPYVLEEPKLDIAPHKTVLKVKTLHKDEVKFINETLARESENGFAFKEMPNNLSEKT